MSNTTSKVITTKAGEALIAKMQAENKVLVIDKFVFANVPNRPDFPQREDTVPTADVVHESTVHEQGRLTENSVIYSTTLASDVGSFTFNWSGLYCSEHNTLVAINYPPAIDKTVDGPGVTGNTLVRSFVLEYKGIAETTNITVDPESWQYNAHKRMGKMDNDTSQAIIDQNGKDWFIEDGFIVTPQSTAYNIKAGAGYVSGNRIALEFDRIVQVPDKPSFIYVDAWREGTPTGEWLTKFNFVVSADEKDDYTDAKGVKHFVSKNAQVFVDGSVSDLRAKGESASRDWTSQQDLENLAKSLSIPISDIAYWTKDETLTSRTNARVYGGVVYSAYLSSQSNPIVCGENPNTNFIAWGLHTELISASESFNVHKTTLLRVGESLDDFNAVVNSEGLDGKRWFYLPETARGTVKEVNIPEVKTELGTFLVETSKQNQFKKQNDIRGWILPEDPKLQIDDALVRAYSEKSVVKIPATKETYLYSKTLDLTNKDLKGDGLFASKLKWVGDPNVEQIHTNSSTAISDIFLHGGWDGKTANLNGDMIRAVSETFGGDLRLNNVRLLSAPRDMVRMSKFGYSFLNGVVGNAAGRHGLHLDGEDGGTCTTVEVTGQSKLSDCPFGFGVRIYNGHNITLGGASSTEYTKGVELAGIHNRVITLSGFYNEFGPHLDFLTLTGSGIGLIVEGCFGGGKKIDFNYNFQSVRIGQNSNLTVPDNAHSWEVSTSSYSMFGALSCLLGLKAKNISGASPANSSDSAPLSGYSKLIHAFMNNGSVRAGITSDGGMKLGGGTWDSPFLGLGDWAYIFKGTGNELRIKFGSMPTGPNDGQMFQLSN